MGCRTFRKQEKVPERSNGERGHAEGSLNPDVNKSCPSRDWHLLLQPQVASDTIDHPGKGEGFKGWGKFAVSRYLGVKRHL